MEDKLKINKKAYFIGFSLSLVSDQQRLLDKKTVSSQGSISKK
jgi:hypothetical protein